MTLTGPLVDCCNQFMEFCKIGVIDPALPTLIPVRAQSTKIKHKLNSETGRATKRGQVRQTLQAERGKRRDINIEIQLVSSEPPCVAVVVPIVLMSTA